VGWLRDREEAAVNKPKRAGSAYERLVADYCAAAPWNLPWDRAPLRGTRDLLDLQGPQHAGFLIGCKAITRGTAFGQRISEAMDQCDQALVNFGRPAAVNGHGYRIVDPGGIIPAQVMQRPGYPLGKNYVVTQLDYFLGLVGERIEWRSK
jgi:hypothetical protein